MPRRVTLPGADELFRSTGTSTAPPPVDPDAGTPGPRATGPGSGPAPAPSAGSGRRVRDLGPRQPTGRERHAEKITVYVSPEELVDLEHARLILRANHGLAVDRGRIVREALAVVLADLDAKGEDSILARRLRV